MHKDTISPPCTCADTTDLEQRLAACQAELAAALAKIAALQRQATIRIQAFTLAVLVVEAPADAAPARSTFAEDTVRRRPAVIRREPRTEVIDVPCVEVRP